MLELKNKIRQEAQTKQLLNSSISPTSRQGLQDPILKQVFPQYIYSAPFGYPKRLNGVFLRKIAENINVSSVLKTIKDGVILTDHEIAIREGIILTESEEKERQEIVRLFNNPNPEDTFEDFLSKLIEDVLVVEAGCIVNVFNGEKGYNGYNKLVQLRVVDGDSILKNPNVYGSYDDRDSVITDFSRVYDNIKQQSDYKQAQSMYSHSYSSRAGFFQYTGALAYSIPVPYGKDELVYIQFNPSTRSVYTNGSPVSDAVDVILALTYGVKFHLDFYLNGNTPEGLIQLAGGNPRDVENLKQQLEDSTYTFDEGTGYERRMGYVMPIVTNDNINFVPLTFNAKDMDIISNNILLNKLLWQRFGLTADEMGHTDNSNRATSDSQTKNAQRKAIAPILKRLASHFNKSIIEKFFSVGDKVYFKWKHDTTEQERTKLDIYKTKLDLGITTWEMIAEEEGIDMKKLQEFKQKNKEQISSQSPTFEEEKVENKSLSDSEQKELVLKTPLERVLEEYIEEVEKEIKNIKNED